MTSSTIAKDVDDFVDYYLASWLSCVVHFLHALYDMFHSQKIL